MKTRILLILLALGGLIAALSIGLGGIIGNAHASTPEDTYLAALARHNIGGDPAALIGAGRDVCDALGAPNIAIGMALLKPDAEMYGQGLSGPQVAQAQRDAVNSFCPDKAWWRD